MNGKLQDEEAAIDQEIVNELIALTPEWWRAATLEVTYSTDGGVLRLAHVISSPEGHREIVDLSGELFDATYRLGRLFEQHGRHWKSVLYCIQLEQDGSWKYTVDFRY